LIRWPVRPLSGAGKIEALVQNIRQDWWNKNELIQMMLLLEFNRQVLIFSFFFSNYGWLIVG
jgi:hypothetical protein